MINNQPNTIYLNTNVGEECDISLTPEAAEIISNLPKGDTISAWVSDAIVQKSKQGSV